jgi:hypothetical protein
MRFPLICFPAWLTLLSRRWRERLSSKMFGTFLPGYAASHPKLYNLRILHMTQRKLKSRELNITILKVSARPHTRRATLSYLMLPIHKMSYEVSRQWTALLRQDDCQWGSILGRLEAEGWWPPEGWPQVCNPCCSCAEPTSGHALLQALGTCPLSSDHSAMADPTDSGIFHTSGRSCQLFAPLVAYTREALPFTEKDTR